ncbi:MAG: chorismate synthase, partial [Planctomycetota bacterium]
MEVLGGPYFSVAGAGESHGPAITSLVNGCPPGLRILCRDVQSYLDRRRPGGNKHGTPRNEKDKVLFLSGLYRDDHEQLLSGGTLRADVGDATFETDLYGDGLTTGEPIAAIVLSTSKKSGDYTQFTGPTGEVRPGHTDLVKFHQSGGYIDVRGGGRSSYRSTISDVIGGSVARLFLREHFGTRIVSSITRVGPLKAKQGLADVSEEGDALEAMLADAAIPSVDAAFAADAAELIKKTRQKGDSLGACVEVWAFDVPPLLGNPLYQSLKVRLMGALGGLNAVQSCEVGDGLDVIGRLGSENNDAIRSDGYQSNTHGGLIGGVTTGSPLVMRVGFKPTSTINLPQPSVRKNLDEIEFELAKG